MIIKTESGLLLASLLAGGFFLAPGSCAATADNPATVAQKTASASPTASNKTKFAGTRPSLYYKRNWGVDVVGVHPVSSGEMLEFRFRVLDKSKANALFDKTLRPYLIDNASGTRLAVPTLENIGTLRQDIAANPERIYYMIFGNPGRIVKVGSSVDVVIGNFHIDGLIVD
ncbi:hypothetical protein [Sideroxydans lithotrophicus]|uniref:Putative transmembrane protein n=1 Tax=Sideroxydans lithotrophicus (strain ES-1) TaxID=580332 RepID=D5CSV8_SIDLE|nr:hypothetical protein [Sideroxydans lithotrophicus]ADE12044.1 putative transmembrane protein [Sideroxydans lithotrophicus ES-1]